MDQQYWWTFAASGLLSALLDIATTHAVPILGTVSAVIVIILATIVSWTGYFLFAAFWLYVLSYDYPKFDVGHFLLNVRRLVRPYMWMIAIFIATIIVWGAVVVALLFGLGVTSRSDYLQAYPLVILCMFVVLSTAVWMRLSFSCVSFMDGDTAAIKVAWRRTKHYWWDMTVAALVFTIPCLVLKLSLKWGGDTSNQWRFTGNADFVC